MAKSPKKQFIWEQKYRPEKIEECVLPPHLRTLFSEMVSGEKIPNMILAGSPGIGKSTVVRCLINEIGGPYLKVNGSDAKESGIDALRTRIRQFCSTSSINGKQKILWIDEADFLSASVVQPALRMFLDEFSANARFVMTANFKHRFTDAITSRCTFIDFDYTKDDLMGMRRDFYKRIMGILDAENVSYTKDVLKELITSYAPDWRRIIGMLQTYSLKSNTIDSGILKNVLQEDYAPLVKALKENNFRDMKQWVANKMRSSSSNAIYRKIYDEMYAFVEPQSIPALVVVLADYAYKDAMVVDKEINMVACFTTVMTNISFKQ